MIKQSHIVTGQVSITISLIVLGLSAVLGTLGVDVMLVVSLVLIGVLGIPHGAADHLIFNKLFPKQKHNQARFYALYLSGILVYSLLWFLGPLLALGLFILISAYHFGESNWQYYNWRSEFSKRFVYFNWGI